LPALFTVAVLPLPLCGLSAARPSPRLNVVIPNPAALLADGGEGPAFIPTCLCMNVRCGRSLW
jgi:hypothetical protein